MWYCDLWRRCRRGICNLHVVWANRRLDARSEVLGCLIIYETTLMW